MRPRDLTGAVVVAFAVLAGGCVTSTFVATDGRAAGRPITHPSLFIDRLPPMPFHSIGIIEVKAPAGSTLDVVVEEATRKGSEIGCDFVVDRAIYRVSFGIPGARAMVAQLGAAPVIAPAPVVAPPPAAIYTPPPDLREFICGVADQPAEAPPPLPAGAGPAPAGAGAPVGAAATNENRPAHVGAVVDVRSAPSKVAPCLTTLTVGAPVTVVGGQTQEGWVPVRLPDGRTGYLWATAVNYDP